MAFPTLQRGTAFQILAGDGATPTEAFTIICIATTKSFKRSIEFDDHPEIDCANPTNLPADVSVPKGQKWELSISGRADYAKYKTLEAWLDGTPHNIQVSRLGTGANGGGVNTGGVVLKEIVLATNENATVTFTATFKGQGPLPPFVANA